MWQLICLQLETCLSHQFLLGKCLPELAWGPSCVALAWHWASGSTPYGVTAGYIFVTWVALETLATKPPATSFPRPLVLMLWLPAPYPSQRSLHSAPIFRLLLKVAVNGTHQCDFHNFWGALCSNCTTSIHTSSIQLGLPHPTHCKNAEGEFPQSLASPCHTPLS